MLVCSMFRTTITLPEELAAILTREAKRRDSSVSAIVRDAVESFLGLTGTKPRRLPFAALGRSGHRHTARDAEKILAREWDRAGRR
jgi:Arc/MetJ-type ribon-helix-helix transcriptional regulator